MVTSIEAFFVDLGRLKDGISAVQGALTIVAVLVGAVWAYLKLIRGRVYVTRLEPTISGQFITHELAKYLVVRIVIKNVGLSRVAIDKQRSTIEVLSYPVENYLSEFHNAILESTGVVKAISFHAWIEPGETICEEKIIALPSDETLAIRLQLKILRSSKRPRPGANTVEWNAVSVVPLVRDTRPTEVAPRTRRFKAKAAQS